MDNRHDFDAGHISDQAADETAGFEGAEDTTHHDTAEPEDEAVMDSTHGFGTDERRMHVRAYNHWVMLLGEKSFPSIDDLDLENLDDFADNSVLLDFTAGLENPGISHIGDAVLRESEIDEEVAYVSQIPGRSLLSRITDHYMEIIANQAPIGFEAEFVNQAGRTIMYRGILLPFSSDDDSIDFVFGVINWKVVADKQITDDLMLEVEQALDDQKPFELTDDAIWDQDDASADHDLPTLPQVGFGRNAGQTDKASAFDTPLSGVPALGAVEGNDFQSVPAPRELAFSASASRNLLSSDAPFSDIPFSQADEESSPEPSVDDDLTVWLEYARRKADKAAQCESRSRIALYEAIGQAYDVSLVAERNPEALQSILEQAGITAQDRAPMTPIVKLVFGADYDKTRLTEYAAALSHAHRKALPLGMLPEYLGNFAGGLKAVVREERSLRRGDGEQLSKSDVLDEAYAELRDKDPIELEDISLDDAEFGVLVVRRDEHGRPVIVAASHDGGLTDSVVRKIAG